MMKMLLPLKTFIKSPYGGVVLTRPTLRSVLFGGAGSNPAGDIFNDPYSNNSLF